MSDMLKSTVAALIEKHGGVRAAARATGIDAAYLCRLRDGEKTEPSEMTLKELGLKREVTYVLR